MVSQAFTGRRPFNKLTALVITSEIINGRQLACPQEVQGLGLTNLVWDMMVCCWDQDPAQWPTMVEVVQLLCEWSVFSLLHWVEVLTWFLQLQDDLFKFEG